MGLRGDRDRCRKLNIHAYLPKPVSSSDLLETVQRLFTGRQGGVEREGGLLTRHIPGGANGFRRQSAPLKILLAEDNLVNQKVGARLLEKQGHAVLIAGNGRQALEAYEREAFDLILMDIQMPEMDGFEATKAIRDRETSGIRPLHQLEGRERTPILALTAYAMKGDRERCLSAGMDGFVSKPIQLNELLGAIAALCPTEMSEDMLTSPTL
jgi:CheY-like chemotaxis protein